MNQKPLQAMKKILVPVDFSANSKNALHVAAEIARVTGATLELLHVNVEAAFAMPLSEFASPTDFARDEVYDESAEYLLKQMQKELHNNPAYKDIKTVTRIGDGFLYSCVRIAAESDGVDLVVMGTKGASGATEFFIGSNTEKVIRTSPCPILAIPESVQEFSLKTVLLPSTLKDDQQPVFNYLAEWQKLFDFRVKVLYLNNPQGYATDGSAELRKKQLAEEAGLSKPDVIMTGQSYFEESSILSVADQYEADMIVMATHQRKGLSHLLFGSTTEDTVNHSDIPVLAVPTKWMKK